MTDPLVLLPGMLCDARAWWAQVMTLSRDAPVMVAPLTDGERIEDMASALLDVLPARFALAGLGLGGMVAMELARRAPDRVMRLCLISTLPLPESPSFAAEREARIVLVRAGRMRDVLAQELPATALAPSEDRAEVQDLFGQMATDLGPEVFVRQSRAMQRRRDQQATLSALRLPVLVIAGAHDTVVPVRRQEFMAEMIPHARLVVLPDAGHLPPLESPGAVTRALRDWLRAPLVLR